MTGDIISLLELNSDVMAMNISIIKITSVVTSKLYGPKAVILLFFQGHLLYSIYVHGLIKTTNSIDFDYNP